ncbi:hypothetical protein HN873_062348 [Arachis hypogaea]
MVAPLYACAPLSRRLSGRGGACYLVGLPTRTRPPECLLGSGRSQADTYDRRRPFHSAWERKFDRGLGRRGGMEEKARDGFWSLCASRMR